MRFLFAALVLAFSVNALAQEQIYSSYTMFGARTDLWDHDVDYYSPPVNLFRVKNTWKTHTVEFNVLRYEQQCMQWQKVCTKYNQQGQCVAWETQCVQWGYQTYRVPKRIDFDLRALAELGEKESEQYELVIQRHKPAGSGEDWVTTWVRDIKTLVPVVVKKFGDYQYVIEPKK